MAGRQLNHHAPYYEYAEFPQPSLREEAHGLTGTKHTYHHRPRWLTIPQHGVIEAWVHEGELDEDNGDGILEVIRYYCRKKKQERHNR